MSNVTIHAGLANGDLQPIVEGKASSDLVKAFAGDDTGAPVQLVTIKVST